MLPQFLFCGESSAFGAILALPLDDTPELGGGGTPLEILEEQDDLLKAKVGDARRMFSKVAAPAGRVQLEDDSPVFAVEVE